MTANDYKPYLKGYSLLKIPILENGKSAWPEKFPISKITEIKQRVGPKKFYSQMMLKPYDLTESRLKVELLKKYYNEIINTYQNQKLILKIKDRRLVSGTCWWDPAYGKPSGDNSVIACIFIDDLGEYWLHDILYINDKNNKSNLDPATFQCSQVIDFAIKNYMSSIYIETNGIGKFLPELLKKELSIKRKNINIIEISNKKAKDIRILEAFDAPLAAGVIHIKDKFWQTPFITEMIEWKYGINNKDDGLDAVSGAISAEPVRIDYSNNYRMANKLSWKSNNSQYSNPLDFEIFS